MLERGSRRAGRALRPAGHGWATFALPFRAGDSTDLARALEEALERVR